MVRYRYTVWMLSTGTGYRNIPVPLVPVGVCGAVPGLWQLGTIRYRYHYSTGSSKLALSCYLSWANTATVMRGQTGY
jgi:hypothetical protein